MHRFGAWSQTARRLVRVVTLSVLGCLGGRPSAATDARVLARAGNDVLSLSGSPGASAPPQWHAQLAHGRPFVGTGLTEDAARLRYVAPSYGLAVGWTRTRSPIHAQHDLSAVVQVRGATLRAGVGLRFVQRDFAHYAARWASEVALGAGAHIRDASFVLRAVPHSIANARPRLDLAARWTLRRPLGVVLQHVREPGLPGRWRSALELVQHDIGWYGGYDVSTQAWSAGLEVGVRRTRWVYGARNHPELGWSHAWMLELGSR